MKNVHRSRASRLSRRQALVALGAASTGGAGCADTTWVAKRELAPIHVPRRIVVMVWKAPSVQDLDEAGHTDALVLAFENELEERGRMTTVTDLEGAPQLPRIELAFWSPPAEVAEGRVGQGSITVDCAFVSAKDEVQFVGRVRGYGKEGDLTVGAHAAAKALVEALLDG